jgi:hypothetical protein
MHIIRVIIKGFKSYAAQLDFEPFSPASNVMGPQLFFRDELGFRGKLTLQPTSSML